MSACYVCGRTINQEHKAVTVLVIESHTGKTGSAKLHSDCCCLLNLVRYKQAIEWKGSVTAPANLKRLIGRIAAQNDSQSGSVPLFLT